MGFELALKNSLYLASVDDRCVASRQGTFSRAASGEARGIGLWQRRLPMPRSPEYDASWIELVVAERSVDGPR